MAKSSRSLRNLFRLGGVVLVCALPFVFMALGAVRFARGVDTLPLDEYRSLTWSGDSKSLYYLHRPLVEGRKAVFELWSHDIRLEKFTELGVLPSADAWELSDRPVTDWLLLKASDKSLLFSEGEGAEFQDLAFAKGWSTVPGDSGGHFFASHESSIPFDQFVDVEDAPGLQPEASPSPEGESEYELEPEQGVGPPSPSELGAPTRSGLKLAKLGEDGKSLVPMLSIPYSRVADKPEVLFVSESSDKRFLALAIRFGSRGQTGLWIHDSESRRLLWTRVLSSEEVYGMAWSPDSVSLCLADSRGIVVVPSVLGIESTRFKSVGLGKVTPVWSQGDSIILAGSRSVHKLDQSRGEAELIFDEASMPSEPELDQLVVSPDGAKIAFFSHKNGGTELVSQALGQDLEDSRLSLPGSLAEENRNTWTYRIGNALSYSSEFWFGSLF